MGGHDGVTGTESVRDAGVASTWFRIALLTATVVGVAVRVAFAVSRFGHPLPGDGNFYYLTGARIAQGQGFDQYWTFGPHVLVPTAEHPPALPALLSLAHLVGLGSVDVQRIFLSLVAAAAVPIMGLLGRRVGGPTVGVVVAGIAAIHPLWFQSSGILMSESIYLVLVPLVMLLAVRCLDQPNVWRFLALGATVGLAALTRSEATDFVVLFAIVMPILLVGAPRRRVTLGLVVLAGSLLVIAPWLVRNEVQMGGFALSDNIGETLSGSYCASALNPHLPGYGTWNFTCIVDTIETVVREKPPQGAKSWNELRVDDRITSDTTKWITSHSNSMPGIMLARERAAADIGDWGYQLQYAVAEGRSRALEQIGMVVDWLLVPFAIFGAVRLGRREWKTLVIVLMPVAVVLLNVALFYGSTRMRVAAEPSLALLGTLGLIEAIARVRSRSGPLEDIEPRPPAAG